MLKAFWKTRCILMWDLKGERGDILFWYIDVAHSALKMHNNCKSKFTIKCILNRTWDPFILKHLFVTFMLYMLGVCLTNMRCVLTRILQCEVTLVRLARIVVWVNCCYGRVGERQQAGVNKMIIYCWQLNGNKNYWNPLKKGKKYHQETNRNLIFLQTEFFSACCRS